MIISIDVVVAVVVVVVVAVVFVGCGLLKCLNGCHLLTGERGKWA